MKIADGSQIQSPSAISYNNKNSKSIFTEKSDICKNENLFAKEYSRGYILLKAFLKYTNHLINIFLCNN
jgi:hypothetical protein